MVTCATTSSPSHAQVPEVPPAAESASTSDLARWALTPEAHFSMITNQVDRSTLAVVFGGGIQLSRRVGEWGFLGRVEQNSWLVTELEARLVRGVINVGFGVERFLFEGFVRLSLSGGVSVLAFDSELDAAGSFGLFTDFRPAGLRWRLSRRFLLVLDPLHFVVVAPIIDQPYLTTIQYRTSLAMEICL